MNDKLTIRFASVRQKKRYLRNRPFGRRVAMRKFHRRRSSAASESKSDTKIRELVAPTLVGRYEIALLMRRHYDSSMIGQVEDDKIIAILRNLIPGKFKISYNQRVLDFRNSAKRYNLSLGRFAFMSVINRIYLQNESDLFAVQISFQQQIWRVMRIVSAKSMRF